MPNTSCILEPDPKGADPKGATRFFSELSSSGATRLGRFFFFGSFGFFSFVLLRLRAKAAVASSYAYYPTYHYKVLLYPT
jgi:hypothetical protein